MSLLFITTDIDGRGRATEKKISYGPGKSEIRILILPTGFAE